MQNFCRTCLHSTRLLCRMTQQYAPDATYTSLVVGTRPSLAHYDAHNDPFASNVILPLKLPLKGGHHWKELRNGDVAQGGIQPMTDARGSTFYGTVSGFKRWCLAILIRINGMGLRSGKETELCW